VGNVIPLPIVEDHKYIVFKRDDFYQMVGSWFSAKAPNVDLAKIADQCDSERLHDAVVIRRQDYFASPALATYASMIAIAVNLIEDGERKRELLQVADYFERQAQQAAEEGWKTPDV
jgi:hypothetical protein